MKPIPELFVPPDRAQYLKHEAVDFPSWVLTPRQICDLELLMNGGFNPLTGFMDEVDYTNVVENMRLADQRLWPIPITLDVSQHFADKLEVGQNIALRNQEGVVLAVLSLSSMWLPDKQEEAEFVFGTNDPAHPAVEYLRNTSGDVYLGGQLQGIQPPEYYDFRQYRHTPNQLRAHFQQSGWQRVVGFQTRNPLHRAHYELTLHAAKAADAHLLIHPVVGMTKPGDIDHFTRVRCYEAAMRYYPKATTNLSIINLAMRMAGPREALWHGLIRKNYGCSHFIVGRAHADPGINADNNVDNKVKQSSFYPPYAAQALFEAYQEEIGIQMLAFKQMVYVQERSQYITIDKVKRTDTVLTISGTELRRHLTENTDVPDWFSFPDVLSELRRSQAVLRHKGFTVFFTGLSGSGKSTIAEVLRAKLLETGNRSITLLDGDVVRRHLSSELGFSKEHRDTNIRRIGYVASEITKHGGIALCASIAPYTDVRQSVRNMVERYGDFIEVYVATSLVECERRDCKGLYRRARAGKIEAFTGVSDPYEVPQYPELTIDTEHDSAERCAQRILLLLQERRLI